MPSMIKRGNRMKCTKKDVEEIFTNVAMGISPVGQEDGHGNIVCEVEGRY